MMKKDMVPLSKGGQTIQHAGKGSQATSMPMRRQITQSGATAPNAGMNDYAKATPMARPAAPALDGLGSGTWPGIGQ